MRSNYFAGLFKKTGNSGNSGNQTTEASNDAALQEADELPKLGNQWVTRVTERETELEVVTQVTQELPSTGNQAVALETSNDAASSEQLPKLPKLPEKTSDVCTHIDLTPEVEEVAECVPVLTQLEGSKPVTLDLTLVAATAGLPITVEQFRTDLSQDDLADIAAGLIPVECLRSYAERFSKRLPTPPAGALVRCDDCQHFERIDHPHTGRCAQGHGRHWLWDTDKRQCEDFEAAVEGRP